MDDQLSDADIDQLTQLGIIPEKQQNLAKQLQLAQALRYSEGPGMTGGFGSRVQTAPSPLAAVNTVAQNVMGGMQMKKIQGQQDDLMQQQAKGRAMMAKLLRGRFQSNPGAAIPGATTNYENDNSGGGTTTNYEGPG